MDRNTALSALIDLRQILIEEDRLKIAEAVGVAIEALQKEMYYTKNTNIAPKQKTVPPMPNVKPCKGDAESATATHGRLIDADALKEYIYTDEHPYNNKWDIEAVEWEDIENAPTIVPATPTERTGEWIPVSEGLPKAEDMHQPPEQRYLCQLEAYGERKFCVLSRLKGAISPFWDWYGVAVHDSEVIAWQPLPEPYKGGDDNE